MRTCLHCGADIEGVAFCTQCGTPTGAPARPAAPNALGADRPLPPPPVTDVPIRSTTGPDASMMRRVRRRRVGFVVAGVLVAGGVAGVAVATLSDSRAGSATGADAVSTFLQAVAGEDALGVVDSLAPSELRTVRSMVDEATDAADGNGDAAAAARDQGITIDPEDLIPGLEVQLSGLEEHEVTLAPTVHRVDLRALDVSWTFDPRALIDMFDIEQLTDGQMTRRDLLDQVGDLESSDGRFDQNDLEIDGVEPFLMTVEEGGSWYVSPTYTILEYVRQLQDLPAPDFGEPAAFGAAAPAEAIEATIEAWGRGDVRRIIEALPPSSYAAFYAYRDALDELAGDGTGVDVDATVTLDEVTTFDDERGTGLRIERGTIEVEVRDGDGTSTGRLEIDGNCVEASAGDGDPTQVCLDHFSDDSDVPFHDGIPGIDSFWLVTAEEDGGWFVDPFATVISWVDAVDADAVGAELERLYAQLNEQPDPLSLDDLGVAVGG